MKLANQSFSKKWERVFYNIVRKEYRVSEKKCSTEFNNVIETVFHLGYQIHEKLRNILLAQKQLLKKDLYKCKATRILLTLPFTV